MNCAVPLKHNISFKHSYIIIVQLKTSEICHNIKMRVTPARVQWVEPIGHQWKILLWNLTEERFSNNH